MKLTDLRDELNTRAETTDETPDLLAGVHAKITRTKRRRRTGALGAVAGVALIAALATGLIPGITSTTPQPAETPTPRDYSKDGITLPAFEGADRLEKGWIGRPGESKLDFIWTPEAAQDTRFEGICQSSASSTQYVTISVNDYVVGTNTCDTGYNPDMPDAGIGLQADSALWLAAPAGKPARVVVQLTDQKGRVVNNKITQLALGIYRTAAVPTEGAPVQAPPTSDDDYTKDGVRYRAKIGGKTLLGAMVADRGRNQFEFDVTGTGNAVGFNPFCTVTNAGQFPEYQLAIKIDDQPANKVSCSGDTIDPGRGSYFFDGVALPAGQKVKVTVRLENSLGQSVARPQDWIGMGIYDLGKRRTVDTTSLEELTEHSGHKYRLTQLVSVEAAKADHLQLSTPADTPFLVSYGSTAAPSTEGNSDVVHLTGLGDEIGDQAGGYGTVGIAARPAGTAKITLRDFNERPVKRPQGTLFIALYLPAD
ncbi:hypothetical protein [Kribbella ginsengisoli]|uniref:Uncharacterized protein n=1 Tax=Kribbella ginsengisoli TaxID=363865 RepID=A0ABP6WTE5_9ACTN